MYGVEWMWIMRMELEASVERTPNGSLCSIVRASLYTYDVYIAPLLLESIDMVATITLCTNFLL